MNVNGALIMERSDLSEPLDKPSARRVNSQSGQRPSDRRALLGAILAAVMATSTALAGPIGGKHPHGKMVVANRGSANLSIIDVQTDTLAATVPLPPGGATSEPMYVVYVEGQHQLFVGDRANQRVVVLNARTLAVKSIIPAGAGIWHMWADAINRQLWVNNDIDKTVTVIDVLTHDILATVPIPADLAALGGKPHDVFLHPHGRDAYVSILGVAGPEDYVVKFDTETFAEVDRAAVGKDPHLSLSKQERLLFVACQGTSEVVVLDADELVELDSIPVPAAHGAVMKRNGKLFYTTNFSGGGVDALWAIDTERGSFAAPPVATPFAIPHNLALTPNEKKLYVTHSGPTGSKVTVFKLLGKDAKPVFSASVSVGLNPFGLTYAP